MPSDPWPKDNAFNKWLSGNASMREDYAGEHDALEVGFKAGFTAGREAGGGGGGGGSSGGGSGPKVLKKGDAGHGGGKKRRCY